MAKIQGTPRRMGRGQKGSTAARDTVGEVSWKCLVSCSSVIPADTLRHAETCLGYACMAGWRRFVISFMHSYYLSISFCRVLPPSTPFLLCASRSLIPPTPTLKPLAVINPSFVILTAEHKSYASLFRVEELIMAPQHEAYRPQITLYNVTHLLKFLPLQPFACYFVGPFVLCNSCSKNTMSCENQNFNETTFRSCAKS